jgi:perosamine synthetase
MIVREFVEAIKKTLPEFRPIGHHDAFYNEDDTRCVNACMAHGVTDYRYVKKFEEKLKEICGVENAIGMINGTAALHIALLAIGVKPNEEVLVPSLTFVATANAVCHAGATPHFIDCDLNLKPYKIRQYLALKTNPSSDKRGRINKETGKLITAMVVVHMLGFPAPIAELSSIAAEFGLAVIEDASEALGSRVGNTACGNFAAASVLSFNNNKIVTTNGGGALLTNDPWIAAKAIQLSTTARIQHPWEIEHDAVAWNYRLPNLNAAFGYAQLCRLDQILDVKRKIARNYRESCAGIGGFSFIDADPNGHAQPNHWLNTIILDWKYESKRDEILHALHDEGIKARAIFKPLHKLPMYINHPRSDNQMLMSEGMWRRAICLPSGVGLAA